MGAHVGSGGLRVGSVRLFRHQHVGIVNRLRLGARDFALQWNIGYTLPVSRAVGSHTFLSTSSSRFSFLPKLMIEYPLYLLQSTIPK